MKKALLLACAIILTTNAQASELTQFLIQENITTTQVESKVLMETKPDTFKTTVAFSTTNVNSNKSQLELNKQIAQATALLKSYNLEYELGRFNTHQDYKSKKYISNQTISLESKDKTKLETVTTALQTKKGKVQSTSSYLSDEAKAKEFEKLFAQAYKDATKKAEFLTKQLNGQKYTITSLSHQMNSTYVRPVALRAMAKESIASSAPNIEIDNSDKEIWLNIIMNIAVYK